MTVDNTEKCLNCRFATDKRGWFDAACHRHGPIARVRDYGLEARWPPIQDDDWCGDFERKLERSPA